MATQPRLASERYGQCEHAWDAVAAAYRQYTRVLDSTVEHREFQITIITELRGILAEKLKQALVYYENSEHRFAEDFLWVLSRVDGKSEGDSEIFQYYYDRPELSRMLMLVTSQPIPPAASDPVVRFRRIPPVFHTVYETCRRLRWLAELLHILRSRCSAVLLGGSLSYSKFYNVHSSSDVDLLIVVPTPQDAIVLAKALFELKSLANQHVELFLDRAHQYVKLEKCSDCQMLSQKLAVVERPEAPFDVSVHIVDEQTFSELTLTSKSLVDETDSESKFLSDYRATPASDTDYLHKSFDGTVITIPRNAKSVENGYIATVPFYVIRENRFFLGFHHNLILPLIELRHETTTNRFRIKLQAFRQTVVARLNAERRARPEESLRLSYALIRSQEFSPFVRKRADHEGLQSYY